MRHHDQQMTDQRPEAVGSAPVPPHHTVDPDHEDRDRTVRYPTGDNDPDDPDATRAMRLDGVEDNPRDGHAPEGHDPDATRYLRPDASARDDVDPDATGVMYPDREDDQLDADGAGDRDRDRGGHLDGAGDRDRNGTPEFHAPVNQPTAFGAGTVGGAAAAAALASGVPADEHDPRDEDTVRPGDGARETTADRVDGDAVNRADRADQVGQAVPPVPTDADRTGGTAGDRPGDLTAQPLDPLFAPDAVQGFRDRWRDVQLRFVDDPHAATGEAQQLVEEAIEALSAGLTRHRESLGGWQSAEGGDTEQLRMAVRRYRDFLDRVLGL